VALVWQTRCRLARDIVVGVSEVHSIIGPDYGMLLWWQSVTRGVIIFLYCIILIRACSRAFGMHSHLDIALGVLIGGVLSRAATGDVPFFGTLAAVATIVGCYRILIYLTQRFHAVGWLVKGEPIVLVENGMINERMMRSTGVSRADLDEALRQAKVEDVHQVRKGILERSGRISIVPIERQ
jgi:uncharacterized membrane protein YcaP (DUF421 family)